MIPVCLFFLLFSVVVSPAATDIEVQTGVSGLIEKANEGRTRGLTFGDIKPNLRRNASPCTYYGCKWPKSGRYVFIPVTISKSYSRAQRNLIIRALLTFHRSTCIRFVWRRWYHRSYLSFYSGTGCSSYVGRQFGRQSISLKKSGCLSTGTVQHEVLHALGFHHEQSRSDRDRYVRILTQNIRPGKESNFRKVRTNNLYTPYDFNSVMQYHNYAFSKNRKPTIISKRNPSLSFGRATRMSSNDITRVNRLYQCWR